MLNKLNIFGHSYTLWLSGTIGLLVFILFIGVYSGFLSFDHQISFFAFTTSSLFIINIFELNRNLRLQRAAFIKEYISQFFTHAELYQTFHELIYCYDNGKFDAIDQIMQETNLDLKLLPVFKIFDSLQDGRTEGSRFYHPRLFQGSLEERRLDALLGYFDVIAYYHAKGYLRIEDIVGSVGYFLAVMKSRHVINSYMEYNREKWEEALYQQMGVNPPFNYLNEMLNHVDLYNENLKTKSEINSNKI
jgi:hypothetical protein